MNGFDKRHHEIQNAVNSVIFHAPTSEFTIDELIENLKDKLPAGISASDVFYASELLKGSVCRLVLCESIQKVDENHYRIKDK